MSKVWYGSVINRIAERSKGMKPEVGMGVTECCYTDRNPWEVIEVKDEKHIVVRELDYERTDDNGMSECQKYRYFPKPDGEIRHLVLRNGRWRDREWKVEYEMGADGKPVRDKSGDPVVKSRKPGNKLGPNGWRIGHAERYYDFSF